MERPQHLFYINWMLDFPIFCSNSKDKVARSDGWSRRKPMLFGGQGAGAGGGAYAEWLTLAGSRSPWLASCLWETVLVWKGLKSLRMDPKLSLVRPPFFSLAGTELRNPKKPPSVPANPAWLGGLGGGGEWGVDCWGLLGLTVGELEQQQTDAVGSRSSEQRIWRKAFCFDVDWKWSQALKSNQWRSTVIQSLLKWFSKHYETFAK